MWKNSSFVLHIHAEHPVCDRKFALHTEKLAIICDPPHICTRRIIPDCVIQIYSNFGSKIRLDFLKKTIQLCMLCLCALVHMHECRYIHAAVQHKGQRTILYVPCLK